MEIVLLDLSDQELSQSHRGGGRNVLSNAIDAELPVRGGWYRHYKGGIYRVISFAQEESRNVPVVLYSSIDPLSETIWTRPLAEFNEVLRAERVRRFEPIRSYSLGGLRRYVSESVYTDATLESILSLYDQPWRFYTTRQTLLSYFDLADKRRLPLSVEQSLALLFHACAYVPGSPAGHAERQAVLIFRSFEGYANFQDVNLGLVYMLIEEFASEDRDPSPAFRPLADLRRAHLAGDWQELLVANELIWLENRHLLKADTPRKDFDTRRLKYLMHLTETDAIYSPGFADLEDSARANIEALRQGWLTQYA